MRMFDNVVHCFCTLIDLMVYMYSCTLDGIVLYYMLVNNGTK